MDKNYVIFDLDGTLVDSMGFWTDLAVEYLGRRDLAPSQELLRTTNTMTARETSVLFRSVFSLPDSPESIAAEMLAMIENHYRQDIPLKPGAGQLVRELRSRGAHLCVASATARPLMEACLERLGLRSCFDFLLSCEDIGIGKEDPAIYLEAASRLGSKPEETAVYEDVLYAAETAKKAGFYVVGVYDSYSDADWPALQKLADETLIPG